MAEYVDNLPGEWPGNGEQDQGGGQQFRFAWAGWWSLGTALLSGSRPFLIEFDNTQNAANHVHSVWRDFERLRRGFAAGALCDGAGGPRPRLRRRSRGCRRCYNQGYELSRRSLLAALAQYYSLKPVPTRCPRVGRYDPATEFEVLRLTSSGHTSVMPAPPARAIDRRGRSLLYASNRTGVWQTYLLDLGKGHSRALAAIEDLDPASLALSADDKAALLAAGPVLSSVPFSAMLRPQELCRVRDGWTRAGGLAPTEDGTSLFFVETRGEASQLRRVRLPRSAPETVTERPGAILEATPNPRRATILWLSGTGELWVAGFDGAGQRRVETPPGHPAGALGARRPSHFHLLARPMPRS